MRPLKSKKTCLKACLIRAEHSVHNEKTTFKNNMFKLTWGTTAATVVLCLWWQLNLASPSSCCIPPGLPHPQQLLSTDVPLHTLPPLADPWAPTVPRHHRGSPPGLQPVARAAGTCQAVCGCQCSWYYQTGAVFQLHDLLPHLQDGEAHVLWLLHGPLEPLPGTSFFEREDTFKDFYWLYTSVCMP